MSMPKFKYSDVTPESLEATLKEGGGQSKYDGPRGFKPGLHDATITEVSYKGTSASDANWGMFRVVFSGTDNRKISDLVNIPLTGNLKMRTRSKPEGSAGPFKRLVGILNALGVETATASNILPTIERLFSNEDALLGKNVKIKVDYRGNFIRYEGGSRADNSVSYTIQLAGGEKVLATGSKDAMVFTGTDAYKAAVAYAVANNITLDEYTSVVGYDRADIANNLSGSTDTNW